MKNIDRHTFKNIKHLWKQKLVTLFQIFLTILYSTCFFINYLYDFHKIGNPSLEIKDFNLVPYIPVNITTDALWVITTQR